MKYRYTAIALTSLLTLSLMTSCSGRADKPSPTSAETTAATVEAIADIEAPFEAEGMRFSVKSGFYDSPFYLTISAAEGSDIYYTLDGSEPTSASTRYEAPLLIADRSDEENRLSAHNDIAQPVEYADDFVPRKKVDKATVVRAVTIDGNGVISPVVSCTYFVGFGSKADYYKNVKTVSLITDEDSLFSYENGIYVLGKVYDDWKNGSGYDPETPEWSMPANYTQKGREWERRAVIQFFEGGQLAAGQDVGIRIHGGATRSYSQKSLNVYARKDYGAPKLEYDLFSGAVGRKSDGEPVTVFDSFTLRNGGNDAQYTRFRDKLIQSLVSDRQFLTQGMEPCILFINGEYWGHYELTEKLDDKFISTHYGIPAKDVCIIKKETLDDGSEETFAEWEQLREWIKKTDFSEQSAYDELCRRVDMQGFMDYISVEIYINNADWGKPNSVMWKAETAGDSPYSDGRWRFVMFDTEFSSGLYGKAQPSEDSFGKLLGSDSFLGDLFSGALENEGFRRQFRETFLDIADNSFSSGRVNAGIDRLSAEYHDMTIDAYDRFWSGWYGGFEAENTYEHEVSLLRRFFNERHDYIVKYLDEYV